MPRMDGTGPQGLGARTGRGMGPCGSGSAKEMGFGVGKFSGRQYLTDKEEIEELEEEAKLMEKDLEALKAKISQLRR